jgi:hypothetical protein
LPFFDNLQGFTHKNTLPETWHLLEINALELFQ